MVGPMVYPRRNLYHRRRSYGRLSGVKGQLKAAGRNFLASLAGGLGLLTGLALGKILGLPAWAGGVLMAAGFGA